MRRAQTEMGYPVTAQASVQYSAVGLRYAQALFDMASEGKALETVERDLTQFAGLTRSHPDLARVLASPLVKVSEKVATINAIAGKLGLSDLVAKLAGVVVTNRRGTELLAIADSFARLCADARGAKRVTVTSAKELTEEQTSAVQAMLAKALGSTVEMTAQVDPRLIDGLQVKIGSRLVDASLRAKLDALKSAMKGA